MNRTTRLAGLLAGVPLSLALLAAPASAADVRGNGQGSSAARVDQAGADRSTGRPADAGRPVEPAESESAKAQPAKAQPAQSQPAKSQPAKAQPVKSQPAKAQPAKAQPAQSQPATSTPTQPATAKPTTAAPARPAPAAPDAPLPGLVVTEVPSTDVPATDVPATDVPALTAPVDRGPALQDDLRTALSALPVPLPVETPMGPPTDWTPEQEAAATDEAMGPPTGTVQELAPPAVETSLTPSATAAWGPPSTEMGPPTGWAAPAPVALPLTGGELVLLVELSLVLLLAGVALVIASRLRWPDVETI